MEIINSEPKFAGMVEVYDKKIYIDTSNGTGFFEVFETLKGTIIKLSNYGMSVCKIDFDDSKQNVCLFILEGMLKYDATRGTILSSFLYQFVKSRIIDEGRKKQTENKNSTFSYICDPLNKIELIKRTSKWDDKWKNIMFRIFVMGDEINDVAKDENFTPWGLTRAIRRKLEEARKI